MNDDIHGWGVRAWIGGIVWTACALASVWAGDAAAFPQQNALRPAGPQAAQIVRLWNLTLIICGAVFAAVLLATLIALVRRRGGKLAPTSVPASDEPHERRARGLVIGATGLSVALLVGLVVADALTDRALSRLPVDNPVRIDVTGQQWWWQAVYVTDDEKPPVTTANELHVPIGRPVVVSLKAGDVIHSFWIPSLHGKQDMLPGVDSTIEFRADKPGIYRGQCAEFCGAEHALMAMLVVADPPDRYAAWLEQQGTPAVIATDALTQQGQRIFEQASCAGCHTVRGTSAHGTLAPDLTHLMSRETLAAGAFANTPDNLAKWIRDPDALKPGTTMPAVPLGAADLRAVVAWLGTLQ
jgi:cytochrome c oxidase subunit 2